MTLMKLAPESVRLRRMAKAYAAGEMSEAEYREARRVVIDTFCRGPVPDDDTRRRGDEEPTLRNPGRPGPSPGAAPDLVVEVAGRRWMWFVLLALLAVAAVMISAPEAFAATAPTEVPAVRDRTPDPAGSPRLDVRGVAVAWGDDGGAALPESLLASLQRAADLALDDIRARNVPANHGFTPSELEEVGRFLNVLGVHQREGSLDAADARDLTALIREQKNRRGISVFQLEEVAGAVQSRARDQGHFLAVAYLPAQRLEDGIARIDVLPGRLGEIVVEGGDAGPATSTFSSLLGQPVTVEEVGSRLQSLNALPGISAQATFGPGSEVGEARLRLDLLEQRSWVADVFADNYGDDETGDQRLGVRASWLNPRDAGDRLTAGVLTTLEPSNQTYGYLDYDTPVPGGYRLSARLGNNDFTVDDPVDLDGEGVFLDLAARRSLTHTRKRGLTLVLAGARQALDYDGGVEQTVTLAGVGLAGHRVLDGPRIATEMAASLSVGHLGGDRFAGQDAEFWLLELDSEAWMPVSLPWLEREQKLRMRLSGQWSDSLLPATRRFALGGAGGARAFDRSLFLGDRGVLLALEARMPVAVGELVVFSDLGYGDGRAEDDHSWARVADAGLAWDAELTSSLMSRLSWAYPLTTEGTGDIDDDGSRIYWSIRYAP